MTITQDYIPMLNSMVQNIDWFFLLKTAAIMALCVFMIGIILRLIFGKNSGVTKSVSAGINVSIAYFSVIILYALIPSLRQVLPALPFISVSSDSFLLWDISLLRGELLYGGLLRLFLLSFFINFLETVLPHGHKIITWYLFRCLAVVLSLLLYEACTYLIETYAPQILGQWAGYIIIGLWVLIGLVGLSKVLLTLVLAVINPIIAAMYGFFFTNTFGKQFSKSIMTTAVISALIIILSRLGLNGFVFSDFSFLSCGPVCVIAFACLYLFGKFL